MKKIRPWMSMLENGAAPEWPLGTLAFYGPDNLHASKVVATVIAYDGAEPLMRKWFEDRVDVRVDRRIGKEVTRFFKTQGARQISLMAGIFGCPHEEGVDYPDGEACLQCPFWATHNRYQDSVPRNVAF
ncbi:hypothetical protein [Longimicrobium sp.]|uniref:hypothetical protein n=1 Tax=Longimicrobium sp. TaxID=2029185 RepID=UPI003B3A9B7F